MQTHNSRCLHAPRGSIAEARAQINAATLAIIARAERERLRGHCRGAGFSSVAFHIRAYFFAPDVRARGANI